MKGGNFRPLLVAHSSVLGGPNCATPGCVWGPRIVALYDKQTVLRTISKPGRHGIFSWCITRYIFHCVIYMCSITYHGKSHGITMYQCFTWYQRLSRVIFVYHMIKRIIKWYQHVLRFIRTDHSQILCVYNGSACGIHVRIGPK